VNTFTSLSFPYRTRSLRPRPSDSSLYKDILLEKSRASSLRISVGRLSKRLTHEHDWPPLRKTETPLALKGMTIYRCGAVLLACFPNSDLVTYKKRLVLVIQDEQVETGLTQRLVAMITSNLARADDTRVLIRNNSTAWAIFFSIAP
jgi:hypothetical protein